MNPVHDAALGRAIDRIRDAAGRCARLAIRGGGTKAFLPAPAGPGALEPLSTCELSGIVAYEPSELVVTVRAGTPLAELEALLAERGQCLPFEPPHFRHGPGPGPATVGGMVAAGLAGPARASVGGVRDYLLGATVVNGRGQLLTFGGQVMKNVAGYDVSRVLAGSRGRLGLIAEVSLKVLPVAPAEATLRFACGQQQALDWLNAWGGQPLPLNASCWVDDGSAAVLYLRLRGAAAAVDAASRQLHRAHGGERMDAATVATDWALCRDQQLPWFADRLARGGALWRASVPQTAPVLAIEGTAGVAGAPLVEWHGGQRWYGAGDGDGDGDRAGDGGGAAGFGKRLQAAAAAVGGHAMLFIADNGGGMGARGLLDPFFDGVAPALARIHHALAAEFDPHGVFQPVQRAPAP